jgi:hypothetical protein
MLSREIPRDQWMRGLDAISREYQGWIVTVEVVGLDIGDQEEVTRLPLIGIGADTKDHENDIQIFLGGQPDRHFAHIIYNAKRVWFEEAAHTVYQAVAVESEDGKMTFVHFHRIPPEQGGRQLPSR